MHIWFSDGTRFERGVTPYDGGLHKEAPLERGAFLRLQAYERGGIPLVELYEHIFFFMGKGQRGITFTFYGCENGI